MDDADAKALAALKEAKRKGLSYFDAVQSLKTQGFNQINIDNASNQFPYNASNDPQKSLYEQSEEDIENTEKEFIDDTERELRDEEFGSRFRGPI